jgi:ADP-ribose pyrophosphatase
MSSTRSKSIAELPKIELICRDDCSPPDLGGFLHIVRKRFVARYPDGSESVPFVYDAIDRRALDAVVIAAHHDAHGERMVFLRSAVRPPVALRDPALYPELAPNENGALWELPAGLVEADERGQAGVRRCASRELSEELGFTVPVDALTELGPSTYPAPGMIGERHFYFEVEVDPEAQGEPELDGSPLERFGVVVAVALTTALEMCRNGEIEDAKTEIALRRLHERYA